MPNSDPATLYPQISRTSFTKYFISYANEIYEAVLSKYREIGNIALAIDAGKEGSKYYFDILITNALLDMNPLIYKAIEYFDGTYESYYDKILSTISDLQEKGFNVCGIVSDNLRVQVKAIRQAIEDTGNTLIHVPCSCHCLNLAIIDYLNSLKDPIECIETFVQIFQSKTISSILKISCPKRCCTRWSNIYDICSWIVIHYEEIEDFFSNEANLKLSVFPKFKSQMKKCIKAIRKWAPLLTILLLPFKILSEKLEGDSITAGYTYGYSHSAIVLLEQIVSNTEYETMAQNLISCVLKRLDFSKSGTLSRLLFHLTPKGRKIFIKVNEKGRSIEENKLLYMQTFPLKLNPKTQIIIDKANDLFSNRMIHFAEIKQHINEDDYFLPDYEEDFSELENNGVQKTDSSDALESIDENTFLDGASLNQRNEEEEEESDEDSSSIDSDIDDYLSSVYYYEGEEVYQNNDSNQKEINFDLEGQIILQVASSLGLDQDKATQAFSAWLEPTDSLLTTNMKSNIRIDDINATWKFFIKCPDFADLANIALRFLCIPASEASAERMFYKQRRIITKQRVNTSNSLQIARLTYMTCT